MKNKMLLLVFTSLVTRAYGMERTISNEFGIFDDGEVIAESFFTPKNYQALIPVLATSKKEIFNPFETTVDTVSVYEDLEANESEICINDDEADKQFAQFEGSEKCKDDIKAIATLLATRMQKRTLSPSIKKTRRNKLRKISRANMRPRKLNYNLETK